MYSTFRYVVDMQEPFERLQSARKKAGYEDATAAARAFGWNENTYRSHENGARGLSKNVADKYARVFKVSAAWLLTGEGKPERRNIYPVWGFVGLGEEVELLEGGSALSAPLEEIELPFGFSYPNCGALIARGNSQYPRVKDGEVVIYERNDRPLSDLIGQECVVKIKDGPVMLKTVRQGANGKCSLESHNAPLRENVELEWAGLVIATVRAGMWKKLE